MPPAGPGVTVAVSPLVLDRMNSFSASVSGDGHETEAALRYFGFHETRLTPLVSSCYLRVYGRVSISRGAVLLYSSRRSGAGAPLLSLPVVVTSAMYLILICYRSDDIRNRGDRSCAAHGAICTTLPMLPMRLMPMPMPMFLVTLLWG